MEVIRTSISLIHSHFHIVDTHRCESGHQNLNVVPSQAIG